MFLGREPALWAEAVRQTVLMLMLFGIVNWTEAQMLGFMSALSALLAVAVRQTVTPNAKLPKAMQR
jgi:hypothetical protein